MSRPLRGAPIALAELNIDVPVSCRHFTRQRWSHLISVRLHERRALISLIVLRSGGVCWGLRMHEACACSHALKHAINVDVGAARPSAIAQSKIAQALRSIPAVPIGLAMVPLPLLCAAARATRDSYNKSAFLAKGRRSAAPAPRAAAPCDEFAPSH
jgi:hypothetical protein